MFWHHLFELQKCYISDAYVLFITFIFESLWQLLCVVNVCDLMQWIIGIDLIFGDITILLLLNVCCMLLYVVYFIYIWFEYV